MSGGVVMCRCPNCEWRGVGFHDELTIYEFDKTLDEGTDTLISNLKLLARANMKDYVHFWVECIAKDKIMPMDIGPEPLSTQPLPPHGSYLVAINAIKNRSLGK